MAAENYLLNCNRGTGSKHTNLTPHSLRQQLIYIPGLRCTLTQSLGPELIKQNAAALAKVTSLFLML